MQSALMRSTFLRITGHPLSPRLCTRFPLTDTILPIVSLVCAFPLSSSSNIIAAAVSQLNGIKLFWSRTIEPLDLNFIQYRRVANVTTAVTGTDTTPFTTLSIGLQSSVDRQVLVPSSNFQAGASYEFRLGFPHAEYTYFTNTMFAKAFGADSALASHALYTSTDKAITLSWDAPEYSDGLTGYQVSLWYKDISNGDVVDPMWATNELIRFGRQNLSSSAREAFFGCSDEQSTIGCLIPYTLYLVEVAAIRNNFVETPLTFYATTAKLSRDQVEAFAHSGDVYIKFQRNQTVFYGPNTPIAETIFTNASIKTINNDFFIDLRTSTIQSISSSTFLLRLSDEDFKFILDTVVYSGAVHYTRVFNYGIGEQKTLPVIGFCLLFSYLSLLLLTAAPTSCDFCGALIENATGLAIERHVQCRRHCLDPDFHGSRKKTRYGNLILTDLRSALGQEMRLWCTIRIQH
jgi:hypothetical protein